MRDVMTGDSGRMLGASADGSPSGPGRRRTWGRTQAPSDGWRERLLRRCVARVKAGRDGAVGDARRRRTAVLQECRDADDPWDALGDPDEEPRSLTESDVCALLEDLEAALDAEHRREEARELDEYERTLEEQDADIAELVAFQDRLRISSDDESSVLCPMCAKDRVHVRNGVVFCSCGLRLDGGTMDNITLDMVRERLAEVITAHGASECTASHAPMFEQRDLFGFSFLYATCKNCKLDYVAL